MRRPFILIGFLFLFCLSHYSYSQIEIDSDNDADDFVVSIDTTQSENVGKSLSLAMLFSAALPGGGEYYLKSKETAKKFILLEVGFWGGLAFSIMARESYLQSAKSSAAIFGGVKTDNFDEKFLTAMTQYRSYREVHHRKDSYEQTQILSGVRDGDYDLPQGEEYYWDFGTPLIQENTDNWNQFIESTKSYGRAKEAVKWAIGGLLLGRVVSILHTLQVYRKTSVKGFASHKKATTSQQQIAQKTKDIHWNVLTVSGLDGLGVNLYVYF